MLEYLRIQHLALIDDLELEFSRGLNVLTGETGAGKSFILRALNFLTGDKLGRDMVRPGGDKAVVEAVFNVDGEETILRRELSADSGRSRLFIDDRLSSQEAVRSLKPKLLLHTSQHGQQRLLSPSYQGKVLDSFLPSPELVEERDRLVAEMSALMRKREALAARMRELSDKREFLEFQLREIEKVDPQRGEEEELLDRKRAFQESAQAAEALESAISSFYGEEGGLLERVAHLARQLDALCELDADWREDADAAEEMRLRLRDMESRLRRADRDATPDGDIEALESRLFALAQLKRKLNRSLDEILDFRSEIDANISFLDSCALDLRQLDKNRKALAERLGEAVTLLNAARRAAAERLAAALAADLRGLGFNEAVDVAFEFTPSEIHPGIAEDRARLLWIPNPGQLPQPLDRIASGGELSRFLLALVGLMTRETMPTLIFDEVDAGIGGLTLNAVADRISALADNRQIVLITHWPQLAARAARHFQVSKHVVDGETTVSCRRLDDGNVFSELARMAGGGAQGEAMARQLTDH
ncbi:DNA repair protein RecN (Recombination protein N) [Desulfobaculum xiamenense]|uniref:DNA repair protein RecN n=1 Tax=Desulfobaculum xiamenense TaxID=995050 RepID=A0A846QPZ0_9BACT|nr:AAA family ATPase [Desulfobaculum xiamenense]NJB69050.1 DNA repair protein RecN (Recombination protein N) [Desulfobaculum xiamenense]